MLTLYNIAVVYTESKLYICRKCLIHSDCSPKLKAYWEKGLWKFGGKYFICIVWGKKQSAATRKVKVKCPLEQATKTQRGVEV
jgi:hypothetical protein